ncbi:hypothetical protein ACHAWF_000889 [Thalassiosira exigua]
MEGRGDAMASSDNATIVTIFTSISGIALSLQEADPGVPLDVVEDDALTGYGGTVVFQPSKLRPATRDALKRAQILISEPAVVAQLLYYDPEALCSLKWCQSTYAGVDPIFNSNLRLPLPWKLTRFAGCFGPPIAEWCLARIIGHERSFAASTTDQVKKRWAGSKDLILGYRYLSALTLSILGCGDIGRCIARGAKAFGMKTVGYIRTKRSEPGGGDYIDVYTTNLIQALQTADYVVSVLPSTAETSGLLNGSALLPASTSQGGKCPVFINVGRGDVINEQSLLNALDNNWVSAAILDVFETEPLPEKSRLWDRSDVVVSPHVSGLTQATDVPRVFLSNYKKFINGGDMKYVVSWEKGY